MEDNNNVSDIVSPKIPVSIHFKITGIVFWGLVGIGLIACMALLQVIEPVLLDRYNKNFEQAAIKTEAIVNQESGLPNWVVEARLAELTANLDISGLELEMGLDTISYMSVDTATTSKSISFVYEVDQQLKSGIVTVHQPPFTIVIKETRKHLILGMALLALLFGLGLQWLLQRILTRPFQEFVHTAQRCATVSETRFNENRSDEFGFLGTFINQALDRINHHQVDLNMALVDLRLSEKELAREKEQALVTLHSISNAVITTDMKGCIKYINPFAEELIGWRSHDAQGRDLQQVIIILDEVSREPIDSPVEQCLRTGKLVRHTNASIFMHWNGTEIEIQSSAAPMHNEEGKMIGVVMVIDDIREARHLARTLSFNATHDSLTGLFNRHEFDNQLRMALSQARTERSTHALCYIDLDQFKVVNDTCGHIAGDELLRQLSTVLSKAVGEHDVIARLGGDEFGILIRHCDLIGAEHKSRSLLEVIRQFRFVWQQHNFEIGASIGVVAITQEWASTTEILSCADIACYGAKERGRNRIHTYRPKDKELAKLQNEMQWVSRIQAALQEDRFCLFVQPIVPVSDRNSGCPHYEVLLGKQDLEGNILPPGAFLPAAERFGLMPSIDRWVVHHLFKNYGEDICRCAQQANANDESYHGVVSINLSGDSIGEEGFRDFIKNELAEYGIPPSAICFEVTETVAINNLGQAREFLDALKEIGCLFALDDFGSGMSSFSYLKNLPVDFLKIDGSYVKDLVNDPIDRAMVEAVNQIGHAMNMRTIAEFVENDAIFGALSAIGVDYAQGFAIAEPKPIETIFRKSDWDGPHRVTGQVIHLPSVSTIQ